MGCVSGRSDISVFKARSVLIAHYCAVEFFQLDNKLDATGYIDEDTLFRIFENYSEIAAESDDFSKLEELFPEENNDDLAAVSDIDSDSPGVIGDLTYDENSDLGTLDESTEYAASAAPSHACRESPGSPIRQKADRGRRSCNGNSSGHHQILHDHSRSGIAGAAGRRICQGRRDIHPRHG